MSSERHETRRTVDHLIQDLEDGVITPEDRAVLMDLMRKHDTVRELYLKHSELAALLKEAAENRSKLGTMPVSESMLISQRRKAARVSLAYAAAAMLALCVGLLLFKVSQQRSKNLDRIVMDYSGDASYAVAFDGQLHTARVPVLAEASGITGRAECTYVILRGVSNP